MKNTIIAVIINMQTESFNYDLKDFYIKWCIRYEENIINPLGLAAQPEQPQQQQNNDRTYKRDCFLNFHSDEGSEIRYVLTQLTPYEWAPLEGQTRMEEILMEM